jgi:hypothetical protein
MEYEEEEKYDDPSTPEFYDKLTQHTLLDIDQTYCDEVIRIFQEYKQIEDDEQIMLAKLYSNPEVNLGEQGIIIIKKKKSKKASASTLSPPELIYNFLEWI